MYWDLNIQYNWTVLGQWFICITLMRLVTQISRLLFLNSPQKPNARLLVSFQAKFLDTLRPIKFHAPKWNYCSLREFIFFPPQVWEKFQNGIFWGTITTTKTIITVRVWATMHCACLYRQKILSVNISLEFNDFKHNKLKKVTSRGLWDNTHLSHFCCPPWQQKSWPRACGDKERRGHIISRKP